MANATTDEVAAELAKDLQSLGAKAVQMLRYKRFGTLLDVTEQIVKRAKALSLAADTLRRTQDYAE